jgi:hypothetical protein
MMVAKAKQPQPPNPDMLKVEMEGKYKEGDLQIRRDELALRQQELQQAPQVEIEKEKVKVAGNVQIKQTDAQLAAVREREQLAADTQTNEQNLDAEALLEQQRQLNENARFEREQQFKEQELAVHTELEWAKLNEQHEQAEMADEQATMNAQIKASQTKAGDE